MRRFLFSIFCFVALNNQKMQTFFRCQFHSIGVQFALCFRLTNTFCWHLSGIATLYSDKLTNITPSDPEIQTNNLITNIFLEVRADQSHNRICVSWSFRLSLFFCRVRRVRHTFKMDFSYLFRSYKLAPCENLKKEKYYVFFISFWWHQCSQLRSFPRQLSIVFIRAKIRMREKL